MQASESASRRCLTSPNIMQTARNDVYVGQAEREGDGDRLLGQASRLIAGIDALLSEQVQAIIHHPRFQKLEASWRALYYLWNQAADKPGVKVRVLNVSWHEVTRDLERAIEFDQSQLFRKIYSEEFDQPGGEPYGLLLGDYEVRHTPGPDHPTDDVGALAQLAQVAAAAFAPFITGADPSLLGLERFGELNSRTRPDEVFADPEYTRWHALRAADDARFIGITLPRILLRTPYQDDGSRYEPDPDQPMRTEGFAFCERTQGLNHPGYLWGNAAYAFAAVAMQAFDSSGWFADIRGAQRDRTDGNTLAAGGVVGGLPSGSFETDRPGLVPKMITDVFISAFQEKALAEQGIIGLCHSRPTPWGVFYTCPSVHRPAKRDRPLATSSAQLEAMLQNTLCAARFAHYVKMIGQRRVGSYRTPKELQNLLQDWLRPYVSAKVKLSEQERARRPLREARVQVSAEPGKPGSYRCVIHLRPQYQLEQLVAMITLETELKATTTV